MSHAARHAWLLSTLLPVACSCGDGARDTATSASSSGGGAAAATGTVGTGPGPVTTSTGASSTASTGAGAGGGDPGWARAPWSTEACPVDYATNPSEAFPRLEWAACTAGPPGCEVLIKNWPVRVNTGQMPLGGAPAAAGVSLAMLIALESEQRMVLVAADGATQAAYRELDSDHCVLSRLLPTPTGHWMGDQDLNAGARYVFQPTGLPPVSAIVPLESTSQRQVASEDLFVVELEFAAGIKVFDRARGEAFSSPPGASAYLPAVANSAVLFLRDDALGVPSGWVWDRASGAFRELLGAGANVVADVRGDDSTLVWIETPPYDEDLDAYPPGILYTSPFTTNPKLVVPVPRWVDLPVPLGSPAAMGGGFYAAAGNAARSIYLLRLADGRRWTLPIPDDEFASPVKAMAYIDEDILFFATETQIHRIHLDAIGPGEAGG